MTQSILNLFYATTIYSIQFEEKFILRINIFNHNYYIKNACRWKWNIKFLIKIVYGYECFLIDYIKQINIANL